MKQPHLSAWTILAAALGLCAFEPTAEQWQQLREGEVVGQAAVSEEGHHGGETAFLVDAPREVIWQALTDYDNFAQIFEGVDSVKVLAQDSVQTDVEVWTQPMLFRRFRYTLRRTVEQLHHRLTWRRVAGSLAVNQGSWEVRDTDAPGTHLLVHRSFVRIHRAFPDGFTSHFTVKKMTLSDHKLRAWVDRRVALSAQPQTVR